MNNLARNESTPPPNITAERFWSRPAWQGKHYVRLLKQFHEMFKPKTYLEIGVAGGTTLALAECPSIAVDPNFWIQSPVMNNKPCCLFYKMTSDAFFQDHNPSAIFGRAIDVAFLDGFHWFEFLLRDFINTERHCRPGSVIFMHDCMPVDAFVARRDSGDLTHQSQSAFPGGWAGDVWKAAAILKRYRPDLGFVSLDAPPTGLIALTHVDPGSTVLTDRYEEIVGEYRSKDLFEEREPYFQAINVVKYGANKTSEQMRALLWPGAS